MRWDGWMRKFLKASVVILASGMMGDLAFGQAKPTTLPTTIGPALYLATGEHSSRRVFQFTVGVFAVYLLGGVVIALGPGQLLLSLVPHPKPNVTHAIEIGVGVAMLVAAVLLWRHRHRLSIREVPQPQG